MTFVKFDLSDERNKAFENSCNRKRLQEFLISRVFAPVTERFLSYFSRRKMIELRLTSMQSGKDETIVKRKMERHFVWPDFLIIAFVVFTTFIACYDVKPTGPLKTEVGFSSVNQFVFELIGVRPFWGFASECAGLLAVLCMCFFGLLGLYQLIKRKEIRNIDRSILVLGGCYILLVLFCIE